MKIPFNTLYLVTNTTKLSGHEYFRNSNETMFSSVVTELSMKHNESLMNYILHAMKMHFIDFYGVLKPDVCQPQAGTCLVS